jgi:DNA polymerase-3 subunit gamma/tau
MEARPERIEQEKLVLVFKEGYSFHRDKFEQPENRDIVEETLREVLGISLSIQNIMENESNQNSFSAEKKNLNIVEKAKEIFGSDLVVVKKEK